MGYDIGWFNPSIYNRGMMGYRTPNIDRIGNEGARFTDWYGQQSCTAGRAASHQPVGDLSGAYEGLIARRRQPTAADARANWLPAPNDQFALIVRTYVPTQPILDGTYELPNVERAK